MAPKLRTNRDVVRWIAIQTCLAVALTTPTSVIAAFLVLGGDPSRSLSGEKLLGFVVALAFIESLVFTPPIALRSVGTLRSLNILRDRLETLASADPLTGLLNRRGFDEALAGLPLGRPMAALICDLDHFKRVNDLYGHDFGDLVLCATAELLGAVSTMQPTPLLARRGGEEFLVALPGFGLEDARLWADMLCARFAAQVISGPNGPFQTTMSIGVAAAEDYRGEMASLISQADAALYLAKRRGRNRVAVRREPAQRADAA